MKIRFYYEISWLLLDLDIWIFILSVMKTFFKFLSWLSEKAIVDDEFYCCMAPFYFLKSRGPKQ